ncbi:MAG: hypothetical protein J0I41_19740 [Filimonas sp.]|nr:hypothetical protein [Filimonas sp.]
MDEIKLIKWQTSFEAFVKGLQIEYDAFFPDKKLKDMYVLYLNVSHEWSLKLDAALPSEIKERMEKLLLDTKPEDSI